jgi:hypothetical protein
MALRWSLSQPARLQDQAPGFAAIRDHQQTAESHALCSTPVLVGMLHRNETSALDDADLDSSGVFDPSVGLSA